MKKKVIAVIVILIVQLTVSTRMNSQIQVDLEGVVDKKITTTELDYKLLPGKHIQIIEYGGDVDGSDRYYVILVDGEEYRIKERDLNKINLEDQKSLSQLWSKILVNENKLFHKLIKEGMHYGIRNDADNESIKFIDKYFEYNLFFDDIYLEEYLQSLLPSIHPVTLTDGRPGNLSIKVVVDNTPNAFCLPNGTIMISTGMLSLIDSEQELIAVISHEVAHFVLDHYVDNIIKEDKRQQRAEFWVAFATGMAAAGDAYLATQNPNHTFGVITASTAIISSSIARNAIYRLGLNYSREQEIEADNVAVYVLQHLKISPNALATVFEKLKNYSISIGDYTAFSSTGTHPSLISRIKSVGTPQIEEFVDLSYYLTISNANTSNAYLEFFSQHFNDANRIITRNIEAKIATEDDYILKARLLRNLYNDKDNMEKALAFLEKAENINVTPRITTFKAKGLTLVRLGKHDKAQLAFEEYLTGLNEHKNKPEWLIEEIEWTKKMIFKCKQI